MVVTSFSCTSCCFFFLQLISRFVHAIFPSTIAILLAWFLLCAMCDYFCLPVIWCTFVRIQIAPSPWSWENSWCLLIQIWSAWCRHECSAIFACSMNVVHIYAIFFSEAQCVLIRIKKSTKMWTKPWCGTSFVQLTQVHILLGWDPRMKLTVTSLLQQLGWEYCWAAAPRTRAEVSVEEELLDQLRWFLTWDPVL